MTQNNICEHCNNIHNSKYGSGRFCSASCSSRYAISKKNKKNNKYNKVCSSAKKRNRQVLITESEFTIWYTSQKDICFYCGVDKNKLKQIMIFLKNYTGNNKLILNYKLVASMINFSYDMTIDRKVNAIDYTKNNIVKSCWFCNNAKGQLLTVDDMNIISKNILNRILYLINI